MHWTQALFFLLLVVATYTGRPAKYVWIAMWGNFAATFLLSFDPFLVAIADIVAASLLVMRGPRAGVISALFLAMLPVYLLDHFFNVANWVTYTIIDLIAYAQLAVMGNWDNGVRHIWSNRVRRLHVGGAIAGAGGIAADDSGNADAGRGR